MGDSSQELGAWRALHHLQGAQQTGEYPFQEAQLVRVPSGLVSFFQAAWLI